jgi:hypothetical protein
MARYEFHNFDLLIDAHGAGEYRARVLHSPGGQSAGVVRFRRPFARADVAGLARQLRGGREIAPESGSAAAIADFGQRLFTAVFTEDVGGCFNRSLHVLQRTTEDVRTGLRFRLNLADCPELADLPWEFLHDPIRGQFLCMSERTLLVRYLPLAEAEQPMLISGPLRVLVVITSPEHGPKRLDADREWQLLNDAMARPVRDGQLDVDRLVRPSLSDLHRKLGTADYHVLHLIGHGGFDPARSVGVLSFSDPTPVTASEFGAVLTSQPTLRLAVINACDGARADPVDLFAGTAQTIAQQGVPAVVGMQFAISDDAAIAFSEAFYEAIAAGLPIDVATARGRTRILTMPNRNEWATPVLYSRAADTTIFARPSPVVDDRHRPATGVELNAQTITVHGGIAGRDLYGR